MLPNRRSVSGARCGRLGLSFGSATLGLGRLVRPFHPGLSVWVTVHVFVLSFMFSLGGTFTLRAARLSLAHRIGILLESRENERRFDTARTDAIELYARVRVIQRQRFGHSHDGEFARGVRLRFDKPSCFLS